MYRWRFQGSRTFCEILKGTLPKAVEPPKLGTDTGYAFFYRACVDREKPERDGVEAMAPEEPSPEIRPSRQDATEIEHFFRVRWHDAALVFCGEGQIDDC